MGVEGRKKPFSLGSKSMCRSSPYRTMPIKAHHAVSASE